MEGKFEMPKGIPTRKRREVIDTSSPDEIKAETFPKERHEVKHEMYAIASYLIERYHLKAKEMLQTNPEVVLQTLRDAFVTNKEFAEALMLDDGQIGFDEAKLPQVNKAVLKEALISEMVFPNIYIRAFDRAFVEMRDQFNPKDKAVYQRLGDLFHKSQARIVVRANGVRAQSVEGFIRSGVATAATESWHIILALTRKYNQEFHTELTEEQLDALTPDIKKILNQTASVNLADFTYLRDLALDGVSPDLKQVGWDKILVSSGEGPGLHLGIRDEFKQLDEQERERKECTVGCPGRDAIVINEEGKKVNVVGDVFDFHKDLAKRVLLPNQEVLSKNSSL